MNLKENGKTSKISLSKDFIDMKARNKHRVSVLKTYLFIHVCLLIELHWNLKVCCLYFFFFQNSDLKIGDAAYTWTFMVIACIYFRIWKVSQLTTIVFLRK